MFLVRRTALCCALSLALLPVAIAGPIGFVQHNLVSNQDGVADHKDTDLTNAWGLATSPTSPFWVGDNGSGLSTVYNTAGVRQGVFATIPGDGSVTGVAFSGGLGFNSDVFLFASEDGTISGWRSALGSAAEVLALPSDNVYKGLEFVPIGVHGYALAANFATGAVDVYKGDPGAPDLAGHFTDPGLPSGYAPFNIRLLGGALYVTYAQQNPGTKDDVPGAGHGFVSRFDLDGNFLNRLVSNGDLNSPWGLALAPSGFGDVGGDLLVGNFGDGAIHAYDPVTGDLHETLQDRNGNPLAIDGLWSLRFGNGGNGGDAARLYFTAGPDEESNGLLGSLTAVPEPSTLLLVLPLLGFLRRRRG